MQKLMHNLKKYPLVAIFFAFLALVSLTDTLLPDRERSEFENRRLQQQPPFSLADFFNNEWTYEYNEYTKDQFVGRDGWISTKSTLEALQGKLEAGGVWIARDGYQIAKEERYSDEQLRLLGVNSGAVSALSQRYPGMVSAMVVPSPANVMQSKLRYSPPLAPEDEQLDSIFEAWDAGGVNVIDLRGVYEGRDDEYLFYRTDHHWTTTGGAWLAYEAFCASRSLTATTPVVQLVGVEDFYGTNYARTKHPKTQGDLLEYYDVPNQLTVYAYQGDGTLAAETGGVMELDKLDEYDKYAAFLRGNNGYSVLEGNGEGSILLIKDSYGNCFAPYLIENYAHIGIVDLRSWPTPLDELIEAEGYDEILVLYCFDSFSTDTNLYRLQGA